MRCGFAAPDASRLSSPRLAIRTLLNKRRLRGEIACVRSAHHALWLRRASRLAPVVTAIGDQNSIEQASSPR
jgi:hypothetical protein